MFEESLIASQIQSVSTTKRWTMVGSITLQIALAAVLIALPLVHPEKLSFHVETPLVFTPPPVQRPIPVVETQTTSQETSSTPSMPILMHPIIPTGSPYSGTVTDSPIQVGTGSLLEMGDNFPNALTNTGSHELTVTVAPANPSSKKALNVSSGVMAGRLLVPIQPVYPAIARAAHVSGTVVVEAVISKAGTIESLHVVSGPEMLRAAALDAIRIARYQPFRLNGEPTEVQTTITVNFTLGS
ncbi:energy transducer TonB [Edaphobacter albus]|uniref:energy transducer TonB n=1 Tax=Edaphobacter sp. 4G125 TaxID=2763071 RepID=UPI0016484165|nr:energy transducer TonB [Edaphobacter sp. 4G125]QNI35513.1 energy transducer TonB [Edaphobacter sp. 4G125]